MLKNQRPRFSTIEPIDTANDDNEKSKAKEDFCRHSFPSHKKKSDEDYSANNNSNVLSNGIDFTGYKKSKRSFRKKPLVRIPSIINLVCHCLCIDSKLQSRISNFKSNALWDYNQSEQQSKPTDIHAALF